MLVLSIYALMMSMPKRPSLSIPKNIKRVPNAKQSAYLLVASIIFFVGAMGAWVTLYYMRPSVVFWGAIDEALNTPGILKESYIKTESGSTTVLAAMRFENEPSIQLQTKLTQMNPGESGQPDVESRAVAESLGLPSGDFQRYVETPTTKNEPEQQAIFDKIVGKWVQTGEATEGRPNQIYIDGLFSGVPFGNLTKSQRKNMITFGRNGNDSNPPIFSIDFNDVARETRNGRPIYTYRAMVDASAYSKWYQQYLAFMGFQEFAQPRYTEAVGQVLGLQGNDIFTISIDALTHSITSIKRDNAMQGSTIYETIKAVGIAPAFTAPASSISREEFQAILSGSGEGEAQPVQ